MYWNAFSTASTKRNAYTSFLKVVFDGLQDILVSQAPSDDGLDAHLAVRRRT